MQLPSMCMYIYIYTSSYYSPSVLPGTLVQSRSVLWLGNKENLRRPSPLFTSSKVLDAWTGNPKRVWFKGPHLKNIFESDESVTIEFCLMFAACCHVEQCHFEVDPHLNNARQAEILPGRPRGIQRVTLPHWRLRLLWGHRHRPSQRPTAREADPTMMGS